MNNINIRNFATSRGHLCSVLSRPMSSLGVCHRRVIGDERRNASTFFRADSMKSQAKGPAGVIRNTPTRNALVLTGLTTLLNVQQGHFDRWSLEHS